MSFVIQSSAFASGQPIPRRHTGDGEDLSPPLEWRGIPSAASSLALVVDDPDAPASEPWVHWVIYKIPATSDGLPEGIPPIARPPFPAGLFRAAIPGRRPVIAARRLPGGTASTGISSSSTRWTKTYTSRKGSTRRACSRRSTRTSSRLPS